MKTLLFLRHGKSDWSADFEHDHERPLKKRGVKAAKRMGQFLAQAGPVPDRVVTSTAVRAKTTAELAKEAGGWGAPLRETRALYEAGPEDLLREVRAEADDAETLMLVGHEPTWSSTVSRCIGGGDVRFPTAALARVDFDVERWADVAFGRGQLIWLLPPKALK